MGFLWDSFDKNKAKTGIKLACNRIGLMKNKKMALIDKQQREIAALLGQGKVDLGRVKAEAVIRLSCESEGLDILAAILELLLARFPLVEKHKTKEPCSDEIKELVCTVIWGAPRVTDVDELQTVAKQLSIKYGPELTQEATTNSTKCVNERIAFNFTYRTPSYHEVQKCLVSIATMHNVAWTPDSEMPDEVVVAGYAPSAPEPESPSALSPPSGSLRNDPSAAFPPNVPAYAYNAGPPPGSNPQMTAPVGGTCAVCQCKTGVVGVTPSPAAAAGGAPSSSNEPPPPAYDAPAAQAAPKYTNAATPLPAAAAPPPPPPNPQGCAACAPPPPPPPSAYVGDDEAPPPPPPPPADASRALPSAPPPLSEAGPISAGDHRSQDPSAGWQMPVPPDAKGAAAAAAAAGAEVHDGGLVIMSAAGGGGDGEGEGGGATPLDLPDVPADESEGMDEGSSFWYQSAGGGELFCEVKLVKIDRTKKPHEYIVEKTKGDLVKCIRENLFDVKPHAKPGEGGGEEAEDDFDELEARLAALRGP